MISTLDTLIIGGSPIELNESNYLAVKGLKWGAETKTNGLQISQNLCPHELRIDNSYRSRHITIICAAIQILAMVWDIINYFPGGQTGLKFFSKVFYSYSTKAASTVLPVQIKQSYSANSCFCLDLEIEYTNLSTSGIMTYLIEAERNNRMFVQTIVVTTFIVESLRLFHQLIQLLLKPNHIQGGGRRYHQQLSYQLITLQSQVSNHQSSG